MGKGPIIKRRQGFPAAIILLGTHASAVLALRLVPLVFLTARVLGTVIVMLLGRRPVSLILLTVFVLRRRRFVFGTGHDVGPPIAPGNTGDEDDMGSPPCGG